MPGKREGRGGDTGKERGRGRGKEREREREREEGERPEREAGRGIDEGQKE